jgi:hypothetical protein
MFGSFLFLSPCGLGYFRLAVSFWGPLPWIMVWIMNLVGTFHMLGFYFCILYALFPPLASPQHFTRPLVFFYLPCPCKRSGESPPYWGWATIEESWNLHRTLKSMAILHGQSIRVTYLHFEKTYVSGSQGIVPEAR